MTWGALQNTQHWMIVLSVNRRADGSISAMQVVHGNWTNGCVCRTTISNPTAGKVVGTKSFVCGYHYL